MMLAKDSIEGQRYILPSRFGKNVRAINSGWNYNHSYILFLIDSGAKRIVRTVLGTEDVQPV